MGSDDSSSARANVLAKLGAIAADCFEHRPMETATEQVEALSQQGCSDAGRVAKNLFLKDNRNRFYLCTALHDTEVPFGKELAVRLGLKKNELRLAPPEALREHLGVAPGSVTPLALATSTSSRVVLLLDINLQTAPFFVHPVDNTASVRISSAQLDSYLRDWGRCGHYVDLSLTNVKIDRENPPDLKGVADKVPEEKVKGGAKEDTPTPAPETTKAKKSARPAGGKQDQGGAKQVSTADLDSVQCCVSTVMDMMSAAMKQILDRREELSATQLQTMTMDLEMEINSLRNAAYARGMEAANGAMAAKLSGAWR